MKRTAKVRSPQSTGPRWVDHGLTAAVLLLAVALRVAWPTLTEFKFSEARLEALALELLHEGRVPLFGVPSSAGLDHAPMSIYLYLPGFALGSNPIPATVYGGLIGAAAVGLCWLMARRWPGGGRAAALTAAFLFAVSPWAVTFSRKIWQVTFIPLLSIITVGLMLAALVRGRRWAILWALLGYGILLQVHPSALGLLPAILVWLVVFWRQLRAGPVFAGVTLAALSTAPMLVHQIQSGWPLLGALKTLPEATWDMTAVKVAWEVMTGQGLHSLAGVAAPHLGLVPRLELAFALVGVLVLAACALLAWQTVQGWRALEKGRREAARIDMVLLTWMLVPVAFNLRHNLDLPLHFLAVILPAPFLIVGRAAQVVANHARAAGPIAAGLVLVMLTASAQITALMLMGRLVATYETEGGFGTPLRDYLSVADETVAMSSQEGAKEVLVVGQGSSPDVNETPAIFDVLLRDRVPYRFVDGDMSVVFPDHRALALLAPEPGAAVEWYTAWPEHGLSAGYSAVVLDGMWPGQAFEAVSGPRLFENGIEVQGLAQSSPAEGEAGVRLWLLWQVLWQDGGSSHFTVRLVDASEMVWAQQDGPGLVFSSRIRGDRVISVFDITTMGANVDAPWWVTVGQYEYPAIVNIPVIDQTGHPVGESVLAGPLKGGP